MENETAFFLPLDANHIAESEHFLRVVVEDISNLSISTVEMVAALISVQHALPSYLVDWLLSELGKRADLGHISPAAHAAMQIGLASNFMHLGIKLQTAEREYVLLRLLQKEHNLDHAVSFLRLLSKRMEKYFSFH